MDMSKYVFRDALVRGFNAFSSIASYVGVKRKPMSKAVRKAYVAPFNSWKNRISTLRFVQDIPLKPQHKNYQLVDSIDKGLAEFSNDTNGYLLGVTRLCFR